MTQPLSNAPQHSALPRLFGPAKTLLFTLVLGLTLLPLPPFAPFTHAGPAPLRVSDDNGGNLRARLAEIAQLRADGQRVEIRSGYCHSACTLYLGLPATCVTPNATFGFHGPQLATAGLRMLPRDFEAWSQRMAAHYPAPLQQWFLAHARHSDDLILRSGRDLIAMGVQQCR